MQEVAFITGKDGAYLAEFLLKKGDIAHQIKRGTSFFNTDRIDHVYPKSPYRIPQSDSSLM